jgi:hypothetical protein
MVARSKTETIRKALEAGQLFVTAKTGYRRFIYASCPNDGNASPVCRQERSGQAFTRLLFRCPICGTQFESPTESLSLR